MLNDYFIQNIEGKRIVITGGTTGIGKATAQLLTSLGGQVFIFGRDPEDLNNTLKEIQDLNPKAELYGCTADVTQKGDIENVFHSIQKSLGGIDFLINNAAISAKGVLNGTPEDWQYVIDTNIMGYLIFAKEAVSKMKKESGHIINIGSMSADVREETGTIYVTTKSAIQGFSEALRKEINPLGIKVSLIEPGAVSSDMQPGTKADHQKKIKNMEMLEANDIAMGVLFCLSQPKRCAIVSMQIRPLMQKI